MHYDIAVVEIESRAGDRLGWMAFGYDNSLPAFVVNIVGYPGDKPTWTMWRTSCDIDPDSSPAAFLSNRCDTTPGSSGSNMYDYNRANDSRTIFGVNIASNPERNYGLRITQDWFEWIGSITSQ